MEENNAEIFQQASQLTMRDDLPQYSPMLFVFKGRDYSMNQTIGWNPNPIAYAKNAR